ncbi:Microtubule-associated protein TORTIFOLIA1 [Camellia lanceoleosa]|uniref:Microtubule-associated protein TORTIFOLIA1 n=1 Tax=Camellia lanceoleosa TaxID=1840588 RepID=A0ACC0HCB3_9ERIC|nr:Microtubule-associated protein TORTIFOLIA1 [Camellia lanceoleosa]
MLLNCLYESTNDPKPAMKKESLCLLIILCTSHGDSTATHLTKIIAHIVKRLKDSDSDEEVAAIVLARLIWIIDTLSSSLKTIQAACQSGAMMRTR